MPDRRTPYRRQDSSRARSFCRASSVDCRSILLAHFFVSSFVYVRNKRARRTSPCRCTWAMLILVTAFRKPAFIVADNIESICPNASSQATIPPCNFERPLAVRSKPEDRSSRSRCSTQPFSIILAINTVIELGETPISRARSARVIGIWRGPHFRPIACKAMNPVLDSSYFFIRVSRSARSRFCITNKALNSANGIDGIQQPLMG